MRWLVTLALACLPALASAQTGDPNLYPWLPKRGGAMTGAIQMAPFANGSEPSACSTARAGSVIYSTTDAGLRLCNGTSWGSVSGGGSITGTGSAGTFAVWTSATNLTNTGTSAFLAATVTDETGSGALVFGTSPTITSATLATSATLSFLTSNGGVVYTNGSGVVAQSTAGASTSVLHGGTTPGFSAVALASEVSGTLLATNGGTGQASYVTGDTLYASSSTALSALPIGTAGQVLTVSGGLLPVWATSSSGVTGSGTATNFAVWSTSSAIGNVGSAAVLAPTAVSSGSPTSFRLSQPAHTGLTASTENVAFDLDFASFSQTFATGAIATQREVLIRQPTYAFTAASVITTAATFAIGGAPAAGTNASITNPYALWVQAGTSRFDGTIDLPATTSTAGQVTQDGTRILHTFGTSNAFFGSAAGNFTLTGTNTVAIGRLALTSVTTGTENTAIGFQAGTTLSTGSFNVFVGGNAAANATTGSQNTVIGDSSGGSISSGGDNTYLGRGVGGSISTGFGNTLIGSGIGATSSSMTGSVVLGAYATTTGSNQFVVGGADSSAAYNVSEGYFGNGVVHHAAAAVQDFRLNGTGGNGTDKPGAILTFAGGKGTGTANGGSLRFQIALSEATTGTTLQTLFDRYAIGPLGSNLTASTEFIGHSFDSPGFTKKWATGAITTQREVVFRRPSYAFAGASTITDAATVAITDAPQPGENATLTNAYALWVQSGATRLTGTLLMGGGTAPGEIRLFEGSGSGTEYTAFVAQAQSASITYTLPAAIAANANDQLVSTTGGSLAWLASSGTYTPTLTGVANVDATTAFTAQWLRAGNTITVSGKLEVDPTAILTVTQVGISLPVASALTAEEQLGGAGAAKAIAESAAISADATNDRGQIEFVSTGTANHTITFSFTYRVL